MFSRKSDWENSAISISSTRETLVSTHVFTSVLYVVKYLDFQVLKMIRFPKHTSKVAVLAQFIIGKRERSKQSSQAQLPLSPTPTPQELSLGALFWPFSLPNDKLRNQNRYFTSVCPKKEAEKKNERQRG